MGAGLPPEAVAIIALLAIGMYLGGEAVKGGKIVAHKTKCAVIQIVGKHCEKPADAPPTE